jgi:ABC-type amino acid transport substrate-binding protein
MLLLISCLVGALLLYVIYRTRHFIETEILQWATRTVKWIATLGGSGVDSTGARFSDFVGFAGFSLSLLAIVLGWYSIVLQTNKTALEQENRDLISKVSDKQQQIEKGLLDLKERESDEPIHLQTPSRDAQLIGTHIDLQWDYSGHSPFLRYIVEIINKNQLNRREYRPGSNEPCILEQYRSCRFEATDPAGQHSQVFAEQIGIEGGQYLWRVAPAQRISSEEDNLDLDRISDWSQYRALAIYASIRKRIKSSNRVLVGTTYAEDERFSRLGDDGMPEGHDIDLIRVLIEGCLEKNPALSDLEFNQIACNDAVKQYRYLGRYQNKPRPSQIQVQVKAFPSVGEGVEALGRREVDLFIGSLTKAKKREHGPILFTDGYYTFETRLYARKEAGEQRISEWATKKQKIGVISKSSNYWLATLLGREIVLKNQLTIVTFDTFPALESAFERGEIDAVLLDDVLGDIMRDATPIQGLRNTVAWGVYHEDEDSLGFPQEEFSIGVALDIDDRLDAVQLNGLKRVSHFFSPQNDDLISTSSLYTQLQSALRTTAVRTELLPCLRRKFIDRVVGQCVP